MPQLQPLTEVMLAATPTAAARPRPAPRRVAAVLAAYNRRAQTLDCLRAVAAQVLPAGVHLTVYLLDDASLDGTAAAVRAAFPGVRVLAGTGALYWNGGMRVAFAAALEDDHDFYWWLNDDVVLEHDALARLLATQRTLSAAGRQTIVVGSVRQDNGTHAYGGVDRPLRWRRTRFVPVLPAQYPQPCETMNGNCALIPRAVAATLGNLDAGYVHSMGDTDYGLRARQAGFGVHVAPGYFGRCNHNPPQGAFVDCGLPWRRRWAHLVSAKGMPPRAWLRYTRRHTGWLWPVCFAWPYVRLLGVLLVRGARTGRVPPSRPAPGSPGA